MYLLFDIGGTNLRYAFSKDGLEIEEPTIVPTPAQDFEEVKKLFVGIREKFSQERVEGVVAGIAGPLGRDRAMLVNSPHIQGWINQPLKQELEQIFEAAVLLENDTALVGLGEATRGAGKDYSLLVYITVSTGVGGVRLADGKIDRNVLGFEPGHQIIDMEGKRLCPGPGCNMQGHLEGYISGTAVKERYGKEPADITDPAVWDELAKWLAIGLNNTIVHWSPEAVVLGGSMIAKKPGISLETTERYLKETMRIFPNPPVLKKGTLGNLGGLYGALALAKQSVLGPA